MKDTKDNTTQPLTYRAVTDPQNTSQYGMALFRGTQQVANILWDATCNKPLLTLVEGHALCLETLKMACLLMDWGGSAGDIAND